MKYEPECFIARKALADALQLKMQECGFEAQEDRGSERVFARPVGRGVEVWVYTSVGTSGLVRARGADAIRVVALYRNTQGVLRPLCKAEKRVNRVGNIRDIVARTHERMREVWRLTAYTECCEKCGAPLFRSKSGNMVCAEICWKRGV